MSKNSRAIGLDPGTMFFQVAEKLPDGNVKTQIVRNAFVELPASDDIEEILTRNNWNYVKDEDKYYIIGEDSLKVAKMFPGKVELRRPLQDGVLNKGEDKKILILDKIIESTIGQAPDDKSVVTFCVSSPSVDGSQDSEFHKKRFEAMFAKYGWQTRVIEEGHAVILSERPSVTEADGTESPYSGIGMSCGAGRINCVLAYKGVQVVGMSAAKSGDFVDKHAAEATVGLENIALVTSYKENKLDFDNIDYDSDIAVALETYYESLMKSVLIMFAKKFQEVKSQFDYPLDFIIAGGTSMPKGYISKFKKVISELKLPFKIKEVKHAKDPRNAVVYGCLSHAIISQKKLEKE